MKYIDVYLFYAFLLTSLSLLISIVLYEHYKYFRAGNITAYDRKEGFVKIGALKWHEYLAADFSYNETLLLDNNKIICRLFNEKFAKCKASLSIGILQWLFLCPVLKCSVIMLFFQRFIVYRVLNKDYDFDQAWRLIEERYKIKAMSKSENLDIKHILNDILDKELKEVTLTIGA